VLCCIVVIVMHARTLTQSPSHSHAQAFLLRAEADVEKLVADTEKMEKSYVSWGGTRDAM
jgi:hypothetical protein